MTGTGERSVRVRVSGRVQGVGYRAWAKRIAETLGLRGWVRNLSSGDVEAVLAGPGEAVDKALGAFRRGPFLARVEAVQVEPGPIASELAAGFVQRPTE